MPAPSHTQHTPRNATFIPLHCFSCHSSLGSKILETLVNYISSSGINVPCLSSWEKEETKINDLNFFCKKPLQQWDPGAYLESLSDNDRNRNSLILEAELASGKTMREQELVILWTQGGYYSFASFSESWDSKQFFLLPQAGVLLLWHLFCGMLQLTFSSYLKTSNQTPSESISILWAWHDSSFIWIYMKYHSWNIASPKLGGILGKSPNYSSGSQWGVILAPRGHLKMYGGSFGCDNRERADIGIQWVQARMLQTSHSDRGLTKSKLSRSDVNTAEAERPWPTVR